ncbi:MAG: cation transporting ATPase C-terminal domain-containing protein [Deltaproteobacteria bacterium]|nr:cation transporting ATPase C-terminal domain-containing protein [Deltaproteobacteria bacterium]
MSLPTYLAEVHPATWAATGSAAELLGCPCTCRSAARDAGTEPLLGRAEWFTIGLTAVMEAGVTLAVFAWALRERDLAEARNLAFSVLVFGELFRSFAARSATKVFWQVGAFGNLLLLGVVAGSVILQLVIHHVGWTQSVFQIGALTVADCVAVMLLGLVPVTVLELVKLVRARFAATAHSKVQHGS